MEDIDSRGRKITKSPNHLIPKFPRRIAITGAGGTLGRDLARVLQDRDLTLLDHASCDVTDPQVTAARLAEARPEVVIHAAAFTKVDRCEREPELAFRVNAQGTSNVAAAANARRARLVYISTDYVFDGRKRVPYVEDDPVGPLSVYGRSKLEGERAAAAVPGALVVRTCWLYGLDGRNFVEAILARAAQGQPLRVVSDQVGCPTWTAHLARAIATLVDLGSSGVVHVPGGGQCSRHEFACAIVRQAGLDVPVEAISSAELEAAAGPPPRAPRPSYSVLSNARQRQWGVAPLPHWKDALRDYFTERAWR